MKKTELAKLRELSNEELGNKLEELKSELFRLRSRMRSTSLRTRCA